MKILMLGWELPPFNSGGLGVACYQMCRQLAQEGVAIDFVLPFIYPTTRNEDFMKIHSALPVSAQQAVEFGGVYDSFCYKCTADDCSHSTPTDLRSQQQHYQKFVEELVKDNDYDAIHAHDWLTFEAGLAAKQLTNKPLIAHIHSTEFDRSGQHAGNPLVHDIEYNCLLLADQIVAVSQITKDALVQRYKIPPAKIEVVHNGLEQSFGEISPENCYVYLQKMKQLGYSVVVSLGRLTVQKGLYYLLQAAKQVIDKDPKVLFLIVGDGEQRDELVQLACELGISQNVIMTGFLRGKPWRDAYKIGDMFVMSSVSEPFGLTALEAASTHNAVLLSKQAGVGEILQSTLRFDYWDTNKLADSILNVAQHKVLQQALANNAFDEVSKMSWENAAKNIKKMYKDVALAGAKA